MHSILGLPGSLTAGQAIIIALLGVSTYWITWIIYATSLHPLRNVPGPFLASISRAWMIWRIHKGDMEHVQRALHQRHGSMIRIAPNEIACADPEAIKMVYSTSSPLAKTDSYPVWGQGGPATKYPPHFAVMDEKLHHRRRRIVNHVYSLSNVLQSEEYLDQCSKLLIERLGEYADAAKAVDLGEWLQWRAVLRKDVGFMSKREDHQAWIASIDILVPALCMAGVSPSYMRIPMLMASALSPTSRTALNSISRIVAAAISSVIERISSDNIAQVNGNPRKDMMQQFLDLKREKGEQVDFGIKDVQFEIYTGLGAGSDTTAIALKSVFYHLLKHPHTYNKLQQEIDTATANHTISSTPSYKESIALPYLHACITEAFRMHPSTGLSMPRVSPATGLTVNNTYIPAGYGVGINPAVVHYNKTIFGADADDFKPDRWLQTPSAAQKMEKYMLHFGAGSRTCIGKNISLAEIYKVVPLIVREFEMELEYPEREWKTDSKWFNKQSGIDVVLRRKTH